eukprot:ANDGO_00938.mRNA.1 putative alpha-aspartyl dipeptidase
MRKVLLLSTSTVFGSGYLEYCSSVIQRFFRENGVSSVLFVPFALADYDSYASKARKAFDSMGIECTSIHTCTDPIAAVKAAPAVFVGGGNTFRLLNSLYQTRIFEVIRERVLNGEMLYIGSSAGTNVAGASIRTTNDMPIVYPPSFDALKLVDLQINPHFVDFKPEGSKHMGESRMARLQQFQEDNGGRPVLGMYEGSVLHVDGDSARVLGGASAVWIKAASDTSPDIVEFLPGSVLDVGKF